MGHWVPSLTSLTVAASDPDNLPSHCIISRSAPIYMHIRAYTCICMYVYALIFLYNIYFRGLTNRPFLGVWYLKYGYSCAVRDVVSEWVHSLALPQWLALLAGWNFSFDFLFHPEKSLLGVMFCLERYFCYLPIIIIPKKTHIFCLFICFSLSSRAEFVGSDGDTWQRRGRASCQITFNEN